MEKKFTIEEILLAVENLNTDSNNIPPHTLKIIEEAEENKLD